MVSTLLSVHPRHVKLAKVRSRVVLLPPLLPRPAHVHLIVVLPAFFAEFPLLGDGDHLPQAWEHKRNGGVFACRPALLLALAALESLHTAAARLRAQSAEKLACTIP